MEISEQEYAKLKRDSDNFKDTDAYVAKYIWRGAILVVALIILGVGGCMAGGPQYNLYKANTGKQVLIGEAKARADAAKYEADRAVEVAIAEANADRERAKGTADAQATIAASLTPEYIQWLYVDQMDRMAETGKATVIYVPTEGGIPIMEAGRTVPSVTVQTEG